MSSQDVIELGRKLERFFSNDPRFRFIRNFPSGATGKLSCFEETIAAGRTRKIVLKYPADDEEETIGGVKNEIKWLGVLKHAKHVVDVLSIRNGPNAGLTGLDRVFIILEHLENGSLYQFLRRTSNIVLPNRILWSLFLCLTRASLAMAWPPEEGQEEEPKPNVAPLALSHWDMHDENMLFGSLRDRDEHVFVPILKLIDFDNSALVTFQERPSRAAVRDFDGELQLQTYRRPQSVRNMGINANVLDIGLNMARIIVRDRQLSHDQAQDAIRNESLPLGNDLRLLVTRCLAADPANRPALDELLETTRNAVVSRTYNNTARETDERVRYIIQRYILDASN
ncbi:hypothetical protein F5X98DRAFT_80002 [Xylaria grammica]|nr:hypothetical protein F5X98DRAFT_80002 [Xylaria grammica]